MKKQIENISVGLFWVIAIVMSLGLTLGFYYLIFIVAKKVFFG